MPRVQSLNLFAGIGLKFLINGNSGLTSAGFIRQIRLEFGDLPVIAYQIGASPADQSELLESGTSLFIATAAELLNIGQISLDLMNEPQRKAA